MNPLLEQFLTETRDFLQSIAEKLMELENSPDSQDLMNELFRFVHTLKGNSGLFDFPEMTRVLHAGEDLLDAVRDGRVGFSRQLTDRLLDAMDFVSLLTDEIQNSGKINSEHSHDSVRLAECLRELLHHTNNTDTLIGNEENRTDNVSTLQSTRDWSWLTEIPEDQRMVLYREVQQGHPLTFIEYIPEAECFFKGEDPFHQARQIPNIIWLAISTREPWGVLSELDAYCCNLVFRVVSNAPENELQDHFKYTADQVECISLTATQLVLPQGEPNGGPVYEDFITEALNLLNDGNLAGLETIIRTMLELSSPNLWLSSALRWLLLVLTTSPDHQQLILRLIESLHTLSMSTDTVNAPQLIKAPVNLDNTFRAIEQEELSTANQYTDQEAFAFQEIINAQRQALAQSDQDAWLPGRLHAICNTLNAAYHRLGLVHLTSSLPEALSSALLSKKSAPLLNWLDKNHALTTDSLSVTNHEETIVVTPNSIIEHTSNPEVTSEVKFGRRAEDSYTGPKTIKVEQEKIDRLMGLIGEMVVAKNSLPYLAARAENQFGVRELSREIKNQYAVINRIAEEMQDTIMQVRMMPVSFVLQRFPRLVRDTSRKLGKEVNLILEGENTEADKNIIEALADPLIHIVRNSLDHGIETPEIRQASGKPAAGKLYIRARQESDRVNIEISDDGKGINPEIIKRKAYEKGIIDETMLERLSDQDAVNLVFAAGFSTADAISDLSGRGVGMDVVRNAIEKINGSVHLQSEVGKGTHIQLSLPLSMAVTNVMIIEFDQQIFGIPMESVVETVRIPRKAINTIKKHQTTVLRERIVPLIGLNTLLALDANPKTNEDDEFAALVVRINDEQLGILVDNFRETVDIILKPMTGILGGLGGYAGSALLGDGSVLMVLNPKEIL